MVGAPILLLLACGCLVQGQFFYPRHARPGVRSNNLSTRRDNNVNSNSNTNVFYARHQTPSPVSEKPITPLDDLRIKLYDENDHKTASVATAAADAALTITESLAHHLSQSIAISVAEAVANVLKQYESVGGDAAHEPAVTDDVSEPEKDNSSLYGQDDGEPDALDNKAHRRWDYDNSAVNSNVNTNINRNVFGPNDDIKIRPNQRASNRRFIFWSKATTPASAPAAPPAAHQYEHFFPGYNQYQHLMG